MKAKIKKKIQVGDTVQVILYLDNELLEIPEEMFLCLKDETDTLAFFESLSEGEQKFIENTFIQLKRRN